MRLKNSGESLSKIKNKANKIKQTKMKNIANFNEMEEVTFVINHIFR